MATQPIPQLGSYEHIHQLVNVMINRHNTGSASVVTIGGDNALPSTAQIEILLALRDRNTSVSRRILQRISEALDVAAYVD
jgi:hypothetical protein